MVEVSHCVLERAVRRAELLDGRARARLGAVGDVVGRRSEELRALRGDVLRHRCRAVVVGLANVAAFDDGGAAAERLRGLDGRALARRREF